MSVKRRARAEVTSVGKDTNGDNVVMIRIVDKHPIHDLQTRAQVHLDEGTAIQLRDKLSSLLDEFERQRATELVLNSPRASTTT